jgi:hypothetical protein
MQKERLSLDVEINAHKCIGFEDVQSILFMLTEILIFQLGILEPVTRHSIPSISLISASQLFLTSKKHTITVVSSITCSSFIHLALASSISTSTAFLGSLMFEIRLSTS